MIAILVSWVVLIASTLGIVAFDKSRRAAVPRTDEEILLSKEPSWGMLILLATLCNIAALPVYFYSTRKTVVGGLLGVLGFFGCYVLSFLAVLGLRLAAS